MRLTATATVYSTVCAALCAMAPVALGQSRSDATVFDRAHETAVSDDAATTGARTFTVNDVFERDVTDGCRYRSRVRGTVRTRPANGGEDEGVHYVADLRIGSQLQCGNVITRGPARTVRGDVGSIADLQRAVSDASVLRTAVTGYECRYEPRFEFDGTQFQGRSVAQACRYEGPPSNARGGGPRRSPTRQPVLPPVVHPNPARPPLAL